MNCIPTSVFSDVIIIEPDVYGDNRGYFFESYTVKKYAPFNLPEVFVQDNLSYSQKGVLRGLHYQLEHQQGKLVMAVQGEILDVAVDVRKGSPTFGKWTGVLLSSENHRQLYIPEGFAHGFCVLSDTARMLYKCTDYYDPSSERGIIWNDPVLNIDWGIDQPVVSRKDSANLPLSELLDHDLPVYRGK